MRFLPARSRPDRAAAAATAAAAAAAAEPGLLRHAPHVVATTQGESTVLLDVHRGRYHTLNAVGGRVWDLLASGTTHAAIVRTLRAEYAVEPEGAEERVGGDVRALLDQLRSAGLLAEDAC